MISPDHRSVTAASAIPALSTALHDTTLDDVPDIPTRPVAELAVLAQRANVAADEVRYELPGNALGELITELATLTFSPRGLPMREWAPPNSGSPSDECSSGRSPAAHPRPPRSRP